MVVINEKTEHYEGGELRGLQLLVKKDIDGQMNASSDDKCNEVHHNDKNKNNSNDDYISCNNDAENNGTNNPYEDTNSNANAYTDASTNTNDSDVLIVSIS